MLDSEENVAPKVTVTPNMTLYHKGTPGTLSVMVTDPEGVAPGTVAVAYQWYEADEDKNKIRKISGAITDTYIVPSDTIGEKYYACQVDYQVDSQKLPAKVSTFSKATVHGLKAKDFIVTKAEISNITEFPNLDAAAGSSYADVRWGDGKTMADVNAFDEVSVNSVTEGIDDIQDIRDRGAGRYRLSYRCTHLDESSTSVSANMLVVDAVKNMSSCTVGANDIIISSDRANELKDNPDALKAAVGAVVVKDGAIDNNELENVTASIPDGDEFVVPGNHTIELAYDGAKAVTVTAIVIRMDAGDFIITRDELDKLANFSQTKEKGYADLKVYGVPEGVTPSVSVKSVIDLETNKAITLEAMKAKDAGKTYTYQITYKDNVTGSELAVQMMVVAEFAEDASKQIRLSAEPITVKASEIIGKDEEDLKALLKKKGNPKATENGADVPYSKINVAEIDIFDSETGEPKSPSTVTFEYKEVKYAALVTITNDLEGPCILANDFVLSIADAKKATEEVIIKKGNARYYSELAANGDSGKVDVTSASASALNNVKKPGQVEIVYTNSSNAPGPVEKKVTAYVTDKTVSGTDSKGHGVTIGANHITIEKSAIPTSEDAIEAALKKLGAPVATDKGVKVPAEDIQVGTVVLYKPGTKDLVAEPAVTFIYDKVAVTVPVKVLYTNLTVTDFEVYVGNGELSESAFREKAQIVAVNQDGQEVNTIINAEDFDALNDAIHAGKPKSCLVRVETSDGRQTGTVRVTIKDSGSLEAGDFMITDLKLSGLTSLDETIALGYAGVGKNGAAVTSEDKISVHPEVNKTTGKETTLEDMQANGAGYTYKITYKDDVTGAKTTVSMMVVSDFNSGTTSNITIGAELIDVTEEELVGKDEEDLKKLFKEKGKPKATYDGTEVPTEWINVLPFEVFDENHEWINGSSATFEYGGVTFTSQITVVGFSPDYPLIFANDFIISVKDAGEAGDSDIKEKANARYYGGLTDIIDRDNVAVNAADKEVLNAVQASGTVPIRFTEKAASPTKEETVNAYVVDRTAEGTDSKGHAITIGANDITIEKTAIPTKEADLKAELKKRGAPVATDKDVMILTDDIEVGTVRLYESDGVTLVSKPTVAFEYGGVDVTVPIKVLYTDLTVTDFVVYIDNGVISENTFKQKAHVVARNQDGINVETIVTPGDLKVVNDAITAGVPGSHLVRVRTADNRKAATVKVTVKGSGSLDAGDFMISETKLKGLTGLDETIGLGYAGVGKNGAAVTSEDKISVHPEVNPVTGKETTLAEMKENGAGYSYQITYKDDVTGAAVTVEMLVVTGSSGGGTSNITIGASFIIVPKKDIIGKDEEDLGALLKELGEPQATYNGVDVPFDWINVDSIDMFDEDTNQLKDYPSVTFEYEGETYRTPILVVDEPELALPLIFANDFIISVKDAKTVTEDGIKERSNARYYGEFTNKGDATKVFVEDADKNALNAVQEAGKVPVTFTDKDATTPTKKKVTAHVVDKTGTGTGDCGHVVTIGANHITIEKSAIPADEKALKAKMKTLGKPVATDKGILVPSEDIEVSAVEIYEEDGKTLQENPTAAFEYDGVKVVVPVKVLYTELTAENFEVYVENGELSETAFRENAHVSAKDQDGKTINVIIDTAGLDRLNDGIDNYKTGKYPIGVSTEDGKQTKVVMVTVKNLSGTGEDPVDPKDIELTSEFIIVQKRDIIGKDEEDLEKLLKELGNPTAIDHSVEVPADQIKVENVNIFADNTMTKTPSVTFSYGGEQCVSYMWIIDAPPLGFPLILANDFIISMEEISAKKEVAEQDKTIKDKSNVRYFGEFTKEGNPDKVFVGADSRDSLYGMKTAGTVSVTFTDNAAVAPTKKSVMAYVTDKAISGTGSNNHAITIGANDITIEKSAIPTEGKALQAKLKQLGSPVATDKGVMVSVEDIQVGTVVLYRPGTTDLEAAPAVTFTYDNVSVTVPITVLYTELTVTDFELSTGGGGLSPEEFKEKANVEAKNQAGENINTIVDSTDLKALNAALEAGEEGIYTVRVSTKDGKKTKLVTVSLKKPEEETPGGETPGGETPGGETPGGQKPGNETPGEEQPKDVVGQNQIFEISNPKDILQSVDSGRRIDKVTLDGKELTEGSYEIKDDQLVIKSSTLEGQPAADYSVVMSYKDGSKRTFTIKVVDFDETTVVPLKKVPVFNMQKDIGVGKKFKLDLVGLNSNAYIDPVNTKSSNKKIATIDPKTLVIKARKKGKCNIQAAVVQNGSYYSVKIKLVVKKKMTMYSLKKAALAKKQGDLPEFNVYKRVVKGKKTKLQFTQVAKDAKITYTTSNKKVATVDKKGTIKGRKKGFAKVMAKIEQNGHTYYTRIFVRVDDGTKNKQMKKYLTTKVK